MVTIIIGQTTEISLINNLKKEASEKRTRGSACKIQFVFTLLIFSKCRRVIVKIL